MVIFHSYVSLPEGMFYCHPTGYVNQHINHSWIDDFHPPPPTCHWLQLQLSWLDEPNWLNPLNRQTAWGRLVHKIWENST